MRGNEKQKEGRRERQTDRQTETRSDPVGLRRVFYAANVEGGRGRQE